MQPRRLEDAHFYSVAIFSPGVHACVRQPRLPRRAWRHVRVERPATQPLADWRVQSWRGLWISSRDDVFYPPPVYG